MKTKCALFGLLATLIVCTTGCNTVSRYAFVANQFDNTLSIYSVNAATGQLRDNGYVLTGAQPISVAVDPLNRWVYVANFQDNTISGYSISASGSLTPVSSPVATGTLPISLIDTGVYLYAACLGSSVIDVYSVGSTGALTLVQSVATGVSPSSLAITPTGTFLYVSNESSNSLWGYSINASNGQLTKLGSPFPIYPGNSPDWVAIDGAGAFLYVTNLSSNTISGYGINATTGALTAVAGSPYAAGSTPFAITIDPKYNFLYVTDQGNNGIMAFARNATTGALTQAGFTPESGQEPAPVQMDATGKFLYVGDYLSNQVSVWAINTTTGAPQPTSPGTARSGHAPVSIAFSGGTTPVSYKPTFAFVTNPAQSSVTAFTVNPTTGALATGPTSPTGAQPTSMVVDPASKFAYLLAENDSVEQFSIASDGTLTLTNYEFIGTAPSAVAVDPSGRFLYVSAWLGNATDGCLGLPPGEIYEYSIAPGTGSLQYAGAFQTGSCPFSLAVDPTGRFLYSANLGSSTVSAFAINSASGTLTTVGTYTEQDNTGTLGVDPSGALLFVGGGTYGDAVITSYSINASSGALTSGSASNSGTCGVLSVNPVDRVFYDTCHAVFGFNWAQANGQISQLFTPIPLSPTNALVYAAAVDPSGAFYYAVEGSASGTQIQTFVADPNTGSLAPGSTIFLGNNGCSVPTFAPTNCGVAVAGTIQ